MRHITFFVEEHYDTGLVGLMPMKAKMKEQYYPVTSGNGLAHDVLEHQNGWEAIGSVRDEIEAMGAMVYVRELNGVVRQHSWKGVDQACLDEIVNMTDYTDYSEHPLRRGLTPRTLLGQSSVIDWVMEMLWEDIGDKRTHIPTVNYLTNIERCLNRGWIKARRRFKNKGQVCDLFFRMTNVVDEALKREGLEEGQEWRLSYNLAGKVQFRRVDEWVHEYE